MSGPLVETKLLPPRLRARAVARSRLDELLQRGSQARLTLISAPAGFGKASLLVGHSPDGPGSHASAPFRGQVATGHGLSC
jgi:ATP/maltotriose-dependent transcriptional regulator MalT